MNDDGIDVRIEDGIAFVRLARARRRNAMGLEFTEVDEESRTRLNDYIDRSLSTSKPAVSGSAPLGPGA